MEADTVGSPVGVDVSAKNSSRARVERGLQKHSRSATYMQHFRQARSRLVTGGGFAPHPRTEDASMAAMHSMELGWSGSGWMDPMPLANEPAPPPPAPPAPAPAAHPTPAARPVTAARGPRRRPGQEEGRGSQAGQEESRRP